MVLDAVFGPLNLTVIHNAYRILPVHNEQKQNVKVLWLLQAY